MRRILVVFALAGGCAAQLTSPPFAPDSAKLERADLSEILGLLCPGQEVIGDQSGCRACPAASAHAGARGDASIIGALRGRLLKPDSDDLLLDLNGCGPVLLTHSSSGWFVDSSRDLPDGVCRKLRGRDGRDGLVCYSATVTQDLEHARLEFSYLPAEQKTALVSALDNTGGACEAPKRVVVQSALQEVRFNSGTGGKMSLNVTARCRRGPLSPRSRAACARGPGFEDIGPAAPFRNFRIDYIFNGETFSLAPASRLSKQAYDACAAEAK
ncbi:MAG TPA: hypothetical protein VKX49_28085 [Bryobacteraceae bacterium]|nr:hypothetical protein [Bryobacteraceae bacterium]